jgi:hypothetical protein
MLAELTRQTRSVSELRPHTGQVTRVCMHCGGSFTVPRSHLTRRPSLYCSHACHAEADHLAAEARVAERFWSRVGKSDECWIYKGFLDKDGYGGFWAHGRNLKAHRIAWNLTNGPIPDGLRVCHRCDNPSCVRPDHLFLGTDADNVRDRQAKGRSARGDRSGPRLHPDRLKRGEDNKAAKLTWEAVRDIRRRHAAGGVTMTALANEYGVSQIAVSNVVRGIVWKENTDGRCA